MANTAPTTGDTAVPDVEECDTASVDSAEIDDAMDSLYDLLNTVQRAGEISWQASLSTSVNPCLVLGSSDIDISADTADVHTRNPITLPLSPDDATTIREACKQASSGKDEGVSGAVQKTWELDASQFQLTNPAWQAYLDTNILAPAVKALGLPTGTVAQRRNLCLYDKGSLSEEQTGSIKEPGTVGVLMVCLPSCRQGGDVVISYKAEEYTCPTSAASLSDLKAFAWYGDVTHEMQELTQGHLLALMYNIVVPTVHSHGYGRNEPVPQPSAAFYDKQYCDLQESLFHWDDMVRDRQGSKFIYPLQPKSTYGRENFAMAVASRQAAVCKLLEEIAPFGFCIFVATLSYYKNVVYRRPDEEIHTCYLDEIFSLSGKLVATGHSLEDGEFREEWLPYDDLENDKEKYYDYLLNGNCGEYCFEAAALVIWPISSLATLFKDAQNFDADSLISELGPRLESDYYWTSFPGSNEIIEEFLVSCCKASREVNKPLTTLPQIFDWGLRYSSCPHLYREAVKSGAKTPLIHEKVLSHMILAETPLDDGGFGADSWDTWLDVLVYEPDSITSVKSELASFAYSYKDGPYGASFTRWMDEELAEEFKYLGRAKKVDFDLVYDAMLARHNDHEWLTTRCIPKLCSIGDISDIYEATTKLSSETRMTVDTKKLVFEHILRASNFKLELQRSFFQGKVDRRRAGFMVLLQQCLQLDLIDGARFLLLLVDRWAELSINRYSLSKDLPPFEKRIEWNIIIFVAATCSLIQQKSDKGDTPLTQALRPFVEVTLASVAKAIPSYPITDYKQWSYPKFHPHIDYDYGRVCESCRKMNSFLISATATEESFLSSRSHELVLNIHKRYHARQLQVDVKKISTPGKKYTNDRVIKLLKTDTVADALDEAYEAEVESFRKALLFLDRGYMKELLGDKSYRELILLENVATGPEQEGTKRPIEAAEEAASKRQKSLDL